MNGQSVVENEVLHLEEKVNKIDVWEKKMSEAVSNGDIKEIVRLNNEMDLMIYHRIQ